MGVLFFFLNAVEGFTEAKIERFGQALVNKVIEVCNKYADETKTEIDKNTSQTK